MPLTTNWQDWPDEKRLFYIRHILSYKVNSDGSVSIDVDQRQKQVCAQLVEQEKANAIQIIARPLHRNYIFTDAIDEEGMIRADINEINTLCLKSKSETPQYNLVRGEKLETQSDDEHLSGCLRHHMTNQDARQANTIIEKKATTLSLCDFNDYISFCESQLDPTDNEFILNDPLFKQELISLIENLSKNSPLRAENIKELILAHMNTPKPEGKAKLSTSVPRVQTYCLLYNQYEYMKVVKHVTGLHSDKDKESVKLQPLVESGPENFGCLIEHQAMVKMLTLLILTSGKIPTPLDRKLVEASGDARRKKARFCMTSLKAILDGAWEQHYKEFEVFLCSSPAHTSGGFGVFHKKDFSPITTGSEPIEEAVIPIVTKT